MLGKIKLDRTIPGTPPNYFDQYILIILDAVNLDTVIS